MGVTFLPIDGKSEHTELRGVGIANFISQKSSTYTLIGGLGLSLRIRNSLFPIGKFFERAAPLSVFKMRCAFALMGEIVARMSR